MADVEDRLTTMEKRLRHHRIFTVGVFVLLLVEPFLGAFLPTLSGDIICDSLTVVDEAGNPLVRLAPSNGGTVGTVWTFSSEGKRLALLGTSKDGDGRISTYSSDGEGTLVALGATKGYGGIWIYDGKGKGRILYLGPDEEDNGEVVTYTKSGRKKRLD